MKISKVDKPYDLSNQWFLTSNNKWLLSSESSSKASGQKYYSPKKDLNVNDIISKLPFEYIKICKSNSNFLNLFNEIHNLQYFSTNNGIFNNKNYKLVKYDGRIDSFYIDLKEGLISCKEDDELVKYYVIKVRNNHNTNLVFYRLTITLTINSDESKIEVSCYPIKLKELNLFVFTSNLSIILSLLIIFLNVFGFQFFPINDFVFISIITWFGQILYRTFVSYNSFIYYLFKGYYINERKHLLFYRSFIKFYLKKYTI